MFAEDFENMKCYREINECLLFSGLGIGGA